PDRRHRVRFSLGERAHRNLDEEEPTSGHAASCAPGNHTPTQDGRMSTTPSTDVAISRPAWFRNFAGYLTAATLCIGILMWLLELWRVDLAAPFTYAADSLFYEMLVQSTVENGWYLHNDRLGAPYGLDMRDFPLADSLHFAIVRLIGLATPNPIVAFNVFFLLTFPLTAVIALFVLRRFAVSYGPALIASLLYAFLPYHLLRNCQLFFAAYYLVPLMVLVIVWLQRDDFVL